MCSEIPVLGLRFNPGSCPILRLAFGTEWRYLLAFCKSRFLACHMSEKLLSTMLNLKHSLTTGFVWVQLEELFEYTFIHVN